MANRTEPANKKVAGSGTAANVPRAKVTSSMKFAVLPVAKAIETDEISASVDVSVTKVPGSTFPTLKLLAFVKSRIIVGLDADPPTVIPTFCVPTRNCVPPLIKKPTVMTGWLKKNSNAIPLLQPGAKHVFSVPVLSEAVDPRGARTCVPEDAPVNPPVRLKIPPGALPPLVTMKPS